jgi:hypothetical protein
MKGSTMSAAEHTRALLGPADPARHAPVPPPRLSARDLIARAGAASVSPPRRAPSRWRLVAVGAVVVALAAGTALAVGTIQVSTVDRPRTGPPGIALATSGGAPAGGASSGAAPSPVLVPIAYQYETGAPPAGDQLRALADRLVDAPYDKHTGRYTYHHMKTWGDPIMTSENGKYILGYAEERKVWIADDGTGKQQVIPLPPEYPDEASRHYWEQHMPSAKGGPQVGGGALPPTPVSPLPTDRAHLTQLLQVRYGGGAVHKAIATIYQQHAVPRQIRAEILRILADVPGYTWRGTVTDRAGRAGVAVTFDDTANDEQNLLVFDPNTGELLGDELLVLKPRRLSTSEVILATDRTDRIG